MYQSLWSCIVCITVMVVVSLATTPKSDAELEGLVYGVNEDSARRERGLVPAARILGRGVIGGARSAAMDFL